MPLDQPGLASFRRLTRAEYNNTVRDLLGDATAPANAFPGDTESSHSGFVKGGTIAQADATALFDTAEKLAAAAVPRLAQILPCRSLPTADADQTKCAQDFINQFGRRAYRRPLVTEESSTLMALYTRNRGAEVGNDFANAIRVVITAMLISPNFLYRWELPLRGAIKDGAFLRFTPYEMASRLSYLLWNSMPDDALFAEADGNRLAMPAQIETQARRMLKDAKAKDAFAEFFIQWLESTGLPELTKNTANPAFKDYSPQMVAAMFAETRELAGNLMLNGDGRLETLLTTRNAVVDPVLARLYKVPNVTGTAARPVMLDPAQRSGILTNASFLAAHAKADESNPITRGLVTLERVLCRDMPPPPDDVPDPKPPAPNLTTRERLAEHGNNMCARSCHSLIDPLGFAFENYDAIGGWRDMESGKTVDASGQISIDGKAQNFKNAIELMKILSGSSEVQQCMTKQWVRYALKRKEETGDEAGIAAALDAFGRTSFDIREMIIGFTKTRAFTHRTASPGEALP